MGIKNIHRPRGSILGTRNDRSRLPRHGGQFCLMIRKYWLLENSYPNINYWRRMRSPFPLPQHHLVKLVWGNLIIIYVKSLSHFSWMYTRRHFAIFPQSFANSQQSWPETAADHFWKLWVQRFVCAMLYENYLLGLEVRAPDFFLYVFGRRSKYRNENLENLSLQC